MNGPLTSKMIEYLEGEKEKLTKRLRDVNAEVIKKYKVGMSEVEQAQLLDRAVEITKINTDIELKTFKHLVPTSESTELLEYELPLFLIRHDIDFMKKFYLY